MAKHLIAVPLHLKEANDFVESFHRHSGRTDSKFLRGGKFAIGASTKNGLVGVAVCGRPLSRLLQDGFTIEVLRTCTNDAAPKGTNSFLYSRCWRAARAMGYKKMITYTLQEESGASLRGAGWKIVAETTAHKKGWNSSSRIRRWQPIYGQLKFRWEINND
jgi:hypothetical protein